MIRQVARPLVMAWAEGEARRGVDLSPYCTSFSVQKSIATPSGRFSITLQPYLGSGSRRVMTLPDMARFLRSQAVVSLGWDAPGGLIFGLVDGVEQSGSLAGGQASRTITITGQDLGKVLVNDQIVHASITVPETPQFAAAVAQAVGERNALLQNIRGAWGPEQREGVISFLAQDVADVAAWMLAVGPSMSIPILRGLGGQGWAGAVSDRVAGFIRPDVTGGWNDGRIYSEQPFDQQGSYWDFMRSVLDPDFYELWIDSVPRKDSFIPDVYLTIRPKPFDEPGLQFLQTTEDPRLTWASLQTRDGQRAHVLPLEEVLSEQWGVSDADVFSYYLVTSEYDAMGTSAATQLGQFFPVVDLYQLRHHGLKPYEARLTLLASADFDKRLNNGTQTRKIASETWEFRNRLTNWYRCNPFFESGSVTVAGRDRFRVGDPVELPWKMPAWGSARGVRAYTVATTHDWSLGDPYKTTLNLTRAHNDSVIQTARAEIDAESREVGVPDMLAITGAGVPSRTPTPPQFYDAGIGADQLARRGRIAQ